MVAESPMNFNAHHYSPEDFTAAKHTHQLIHRPEVNLNLDYAMAGLESARIVPVTLPEKQVPVDEHSLWFVLKPIVKSDDSAEMAHETKRNYSVLA